MVSPWSAWRPASCLPAACFCERLAEGWVLQPANTASSLAFVVAAGLLLTRPAQAVDRGAGRVYAAALVAIGLGSAFFHASLTFAGQIADVFGMYLLGTFAVLEPLRRQRLITGSSWLAAYLGGNAMLLTLLVTVPGARRYLFASLLLTALGLEWRLQSAGATRPLRRAIGLLALGFGIWVLDITGVACQPTWLLQGHALWHVLGAGAAVFLAGHYRESAISTGVTC